MWLKILIAVVVLIGLLVVIIAMRPSTFRVERSATIAAPAEVVFAKVNSFQSWRSWSPWEKKDPNLKRTYGGPPEGVGSTYGWVGNQNVGEGRMTIERSDRPSLIQIKLEFFKPFKGTNTATFSFTPDGAGTKVNWVMDGSYNFITKGISMVMDMDKMIGTDFEAGLAALKAESEAAAQAAAQAAASAR
jgi:hypothetical protein